MAEAPPIPSLSRQLAGIGSAAMLSAAELWSRWLEIGARHARAVDEPPSDPPPSTVPTVWTAARHLWTELAMAPWLCLERFGEELERRASPAARVYTIQGRPLILPVRVHDAAQGLAVYLVSTARANAILAARRVPAHAVVVGGGMAAVAVFGVRYRVSDLGAFEEMGVAVVAAPDVDPWAIGLYILAHPVTGSFSREAGNVVWGYPKTVETIDCAWGPRDVTWTLRGSPGGPPVVTVTFPRGGRGASVAVPLPTYTLLDGTLHRTVFTRTGRGERIRAGGEGIALSLGAPTPERADGGWAILDGLGAGARPILSSWTEHLSGAFGPPTPIR
jgi:hypothetical protein